MPPVPYALLVSKESCLREWKAKKSVCVRCNYDSPDDNVKEAARVLQDKAMLVEVLDIGPHTEEIHYHHECKREYLRQPVPSVEAQHQALTIR